MVVEGRCVLVWGVDDYLRCESPDTAEFIRERAKSLAWLRASWGAYYYLGWQGGQYFAVRKDDGSVCRRAEASQMDRELTADLVARPGMLS
jgi:hypothetical protein